MVVQPYLFFDGRCEEALDFYTSALGAEVTMAMRFQDAPDPPPPGMIPPGSEGKIMHASFRLGETTVMASDGRCGGSEEFRPSSDPLRALGGHVPRRGAAMKALGGSGIHRTTHPPPLATARKREQQ